MGDGAHTTDSVFAPPREVQLTLPRYMPEGAATSRKRERRTEGLLYPHTAGTKDGVAARHLGGRDEEPSSAAADGGLAKYEVSIPRSEVQPKPARVEPVNSYEESALTPSRGTRIGDPRAAQSRRYTAAAPRKTSPRGALPSAGARGGATPPTGSRASSTPEGATTSRKRGCRTSRAASEGSTPFDTHQWRLAEQQRGRAARRGSLWIYATAVTASSAVTPSTAVTFVPAVTSVVASA